MTLTIGSGPFGRSPGGSFNFSYEAPSHVLYFENSPRRVRVELGGRTVADSRRAKLLHETGHLPVYYFPFEDVDERCLEPSEHATHCPFKGDASHWSVRIGDRLAENAVWGYPEPLEGAPALAGFVAFHWMAMDRWLEEDEQIEGHPRDPYTRIDVRQSSLQVRVATADGEVLAETRRPKLLFETSLPTRVYVPRIDVRTELLARSRRVTYCPYKGQATYWSTRSPGGPEDVAWSYQEPYPEALKVRDHLSFLHDDVAVEVDGEPLEHQPHRR